MSGVVRMIPVVVVMDKAVYEALLDAMGPGLAMLEALPESTREIFRSNGWSDEMLALGSLFKVNAQAVGLLP